VIATSISPVRTKVAQLGCGAVLGVAGVTLRLGAMRRRARRDEEAAMAYRAALESTQNAAKLTFPGRRIKELSPPD
jgi:hypothetical protein